MPEATTANSRWNQRLRHRVWMHSNAWVDKVLDWQERQPKGWRTSGRLLEVLTPHDSEGWAAKWICRLLRAHEAIEDHCLKPEHDYCLYCNQLMPFQGPNIEKRQAWLANMREKYGKKPGEEGEE